MYLFWKLNKCGVFCVWIFYCNSMWLLQQPDSHFYWMPLSIKLISELDKLSLRISEAVNWDQNNTAVKPSMEARPLGLEANTSRNRWYWVGKERVHSRNRWYWIGKERVHSRNSWYWIGKLFFFNSCFFGKRREKISFLFFFKRLTWPRTELHLPVLPTNG